MNETIEARVQELLVTEGYAPKGPIPLDTNLSYLLDSLEHLDFFMSIEEAFKTDLTDTELAATKTLADLVDLLAAKVVE